MEKGNAGFLRSPLIPQSISQVNRPTNRFRSMTIRMFSPLLFPVCPEHSQSANRGAKPMGLQETRNIPVLAVADNIQRVLAMQRAQRFLYQGIQGAALPLKGNQLRFTAFLYQVLSCGIRPTGKESGCDFRQCFAHQSVHIVKG